MALIIKRSWMKLANIETKQVSNLIFNDASTCILLRARIQNFLILVLITSSSPLRRLLPIPRKFGSNIQFRRQLPISRPQDLGNIEGNCLRDNSLQSPSRSSTPEFKIGAHSPSPAFLFWVIVSTSYVAEGTIFNFPALDESNTDIDTWRGARAPGAIPSKDTCSSHSSDTHPES